MANEQVTAGRLPKMQLTVVDQPDNFASRETGKQDCIVDGDKLGVRVTFFTKELVTLALPHYKKFVATGSGC